LIFPQNAGPFLYLKKSGNQALLVLTCNKCGQKTKETEQNTKIKGKAKQHSPKQLVSVIDKENQLST
jgi:DNA-directed RNA polymerase subunit M/transcription elongation factor TFIIS